MEEGGEGVQYPAGLTRIRQGSDSIPGLSTSRLAVPGLALHRRPTSGRRRAPASFPGRRAYHPLDPARLFPRLSGSGCRRTGSPCFPRLPRVRRWAEPAASIPTRAINPFPCRCRCVPRAAAWVLRVWRKKGGIRLDGICLGSLLLSGEVSCVACCTEGASGMPNGGVAGRHRPKRLRYGAAEDSL